MMDHLICFMEKILICIIIPKLFQLPLFILIMGTDLMALSAAYYR